MRVDHVNNKALQPLGLVQSVCGLLLFLSGSIMICNALGTCSSPWVATCATSLVSQRQTGNSEHIVSCPENCASALNQVAGDAVYWDESSICRAAIHSGRGDGGITRVTRQNGQRRYIGGTRNGIVSIQLDLGSNASLWLGSFTVATSNGCTSSDFAEEDPIAGPPQTPQWPMQGYNAQHTGRSPYAGPVLDSDPSVVGARLRSFVLSPFKFSLDGGSAPAIGANGKVYYGTTSTSGWHAVHFNFSATPRWYSIDNDYERGGKYRATTGEPVGSPAIDSRGWVYFVSSTGSLYKTHGRTGSLKWIFDPQNSYSPSVGKTPLSPVLSGDEAVVFYGTPAGVVHAINTTDGSSKWNASVPFPVHTSVALTTGDSPFVIVATTIGRLYALDAATGSMVWEVRLTFETALNSPSVDMTTAATPTIYVTSTNGNLFAVQVADGMILWQPSVGSGFDAVTPGIGSDGTIYVGTTDGNMYAALRKSFRWGYTVAATNNDPLAVSQTGVSSSVTIDANGHLYFTTINGYLHSLTSFGTFRFSLRVVPTDGNANGLFRLWGSPPLDARGVLHVGDRLHNMKTVETCMKGAYCTQTVITLCPAGTYNPAVTQVSSSSCLSCSSSTGVYCPVGSYQQATCPAGSYCPSVSIVVPCPAGFYNPNSSSTTLSACLSCSAGSICPPGSSQQRICPAGSYCPSAFPHSPCPGGFYNPTYGSASLSACLSCSAGSMCPPGSSQQRICPAGSYCPGASSAVPCLAGFYNPNNGSTSSSACTRCPSGTVCAQGASGYTDCPAGSYCPGAASVLPCPAGRRCPAKSESTILCDPGTFSPANSSTCFDCADENYCCDYGSTSEFQSCRKSSFKIDYVIFPLAAIGAVVFFYLLSRWCKSCSPSGAGSSSAASSSVQLASSSYSSKAEAEPDEAPALPVYHAPSRSADYHSSAASSAYHGRSASAAYSPRSQRTEEDDSASMGRVVRKAIVRAAVDEVMQSEPVQEAKAQAKSFVKGLFF